MKKIAAMCLGLALLVGSVPMFAWDGTDTTKTKKTKKPKPTQPKKTKAKKTTEEKK